jgi:hypothetical protein
MGRPPKPKPLTASDDPIGFALTQAEAGRAHVGTAADVMVPLTENLRGQMEKEVTDTLERIKRIQSATRKPDGRIRKAKFKAAVLALWWEGRKPPAIARILGVSRDKVIRALAAMREDSDLTLQLDRVHQIVVPLAVDNLVQGVLARDKDYTLRALEGTGIFRGHKTNEVVTKKTVFRLEVKTELPPGVTIDNLPQAKPGAIVGAPSFAPPPAPKQIAAPEPAPEGPKPVTVLSA